MQEAGKRLMRVEAADGRRRRSPGKAQFKRQAFCRIKDWTSGRRCEAGLLMFGSVTGKGGGDREEQRDGQSVISTPEKIMHRLRCQPVAVAVAAAVAGICPKNQQVSQ